MGSDQPTTSRVDRTGGGQRSTSHFEARAADWWTAINQPLGVRAATGGQRSTSHFEAERTWGGQRSTSHLEAERPTGGQRSTSHFEGQRTWAERRGDNVLDDEPATDQGGGSAEPTPPRTPPLQGGERGPQASFVRISIGQKRPPHPLQSLHIRRWQIDRPAASRPPRGFSV